MNGPGADRARVVPYRVTENITPFDVPAAFATEIL
jgi:hypothetical protein